MRGRHIASLAVGGLAGCSLLTDIPDDVTSGGRGLPSDAGDDRAAVGTPASNDAGGGGTGDSSTDPTPTGPFVVALDAVGPGSAGAGGPGTKSPLVWTHTTSGTNRALFVSVVVGAFPDTSVAVPGVQYEGAALTLVATQHSNNKDRGYVTLWVLANPPAGSHPVSVTFTGTADVVSAGSISFIGVDPATPYQNLTKVAGEGPTAKIDVTSSAKNMVLTSIVSGCRINANVVNGWLKNVNCSTGGNNGAQLVTAGAPSVNVSYPIDSDWWGLVGIDVKAAPP